MTASALALTSRPWRCATFSLFPTSGCGSNPSRVKAVDKTLRALIDDMFETMYAAPGIGLAAIQIGAPQRVVTMDLAKKDEPKQPQVFINPEEPGLRTRRQLMRKDASRFLNMTRKSSARSRSGGRPQSLPPATGDRGGRAAGHLPAARNRPHQWLCLFIDHISKLKRDMVMKKFKKAAKKTEGDKPLSEDQEPSHHIG